jgi:hypothetical protein
MTIVVVSVIIIELIHSRVVGSMVNIDDNGSSVCDSDNALHTVPRIVRERLHKNTYLTNFKSALKAEKNKIPQQIIVHR